MFPGLRELDNMNTEDQLAVNRPINVPDELKPILRVTAKSVGLLQAKAYLCREGKLTDAQTKGKKTGEIKTLIGAERSKTILATFNASKALYHVWSAKVDALTAGDAAMRKSVRMIIGKQGFIGVDTRKRFINDPTSNALALELAAAKARITELEAVA